MKGAEAETGRKISLHPSFKLCLRARKCDNIAKTYIPMESDEKKNLDIDHFLSELSAAWVPARDVSALVQVTADHIVKHLGVNRVTFAAVAPDASFAMVEFTHAYESRSESGMYSLEDFLTEEARAALVAGCALIVADVSLDPRTGFASQRFADFGVQAFVSVPLLSNKGLQCVLHVNSTQRRDWQPHEVQLLEHVAARLWPAVERASAEEELRQSNYRLQLALAASRGGSWTWDVIGSRLHWDDRFREIYGFTADEPPASDKWANLLHEEDRERMLSILDETVRSKARETWDNTFRIVRPDGAVSWIQSLGRAQRDPKGHITRLTGLDLDITERRKMEEALLAEHDEERDRTLRLLLETAAQGILSMDEHGIIVTANRALEEMFGWSRGSLPGQPIEELLQPELHERHITLRSAYFEAPEARMLGGSRSLMGLRKDGTVFPVEINVNHVSSHSGARAIAFVTDISSRKQAEEALRQSHAALEERTAELEQRTNQLSRLTSELTLAEQNTREQLAKTLHDGLQQLLFSAALTLEGLKKRGSLAAEDAELLADARGDVDDAITAARSLSVELSPPSLHVVGLHAAVSWLADWMMEKYGLLVQATIDPLANSDRKDVRILVFESLRELLFNAVKHAQVDRVTVVLARGPDNTVQVTVTDEGVGFDTATLLNRTNSQTTGLGLLSIRERLMLLGGQLEVTSSPGKGARFHLTAPLGSKRSVRMDAMASTQGSPQPLRILVVDDNTVVRESLCDLLQDREEFRVVGEASNGLDAIAQARSLRPEVIIMDISMPEMDGIEATRRIHAELPSIQIFGLSAMALSSNLQAIKQAGGSDYFVKNGDMQRLIDRLLSISADQIKLRKAAI